MTRVPSRTTPRLLTCGEGETDELPMVSVKLLVFERVDLNPMRRTSVLSLLSFRKLGVNHDFTSCRQAQREAKGEEIDDEKDGTEHRTLGNTRGEGGRQRFECFWLDELGAPER